MIIETGELKQEALIKGFRDINQCWRDFIKASTGKVPVNATPEYARMMLEVIRDMKVASTVGFKPAGGVRTAEDAALIWPWRMKYWVNTGSMRVTTDLSLESSTNLLHTLEGQKKPLILQLIENDRLILST